MYGTQERYLMFLLSIEISRNCFFPLDFFCWCSFYKCDSTSHRACSEKKKCRPQSNCFFWLLCLAKLNVGGSQVAPSPYRILQLFCRQPARECEFLFYSPRSRLLMRPRYIFFSKGTGLIWTLSGMAIATKTVDGETVTSH